MTRNNKPVVLNVRFGEVKIKKKDTREILCRIKRGAVTPNEIDALLTNKQLEVCLKTTSGREKDIADQRVMGGMEFEMTAAASCGSVELDTYYRCFLVFGRFDPRAQEVVAFSGRKGTITIKASEA